MSRWKSILIGIAIIGAGSAVALQFRQPSQPRAAVPREIDRAADADRSFDITLQLAPVSEPSPSWQSSPPADSTLPPADSNVPTRASLEGLQPPPSLAPIYESLASSDASRDENHDEPTAAVTHLVEDGDTLAALAERYLGDDEQWEAIFRANRQILTSPELLPIGAEIVIPPQAETD